MIRALLGIALAGCAGTQPVDPSHTPAGPKPCETMADHLVTLMRPKTPSEPPSDSVRAAADAITRVFIERCTDDQWTLDAQRCFLNLAKLEDADACAPLLTVAQRNAADKAMDAALGPTNSRQP